MAKIEVGKNQDEDKIFIGMQKEDTDVVKSALGDKYLFCSLFSKDDCRWVIEALKKELDEDYDEDILNSNI